MKTHNLEVMNLLDIKYASPTIASKRSFDKPLANILAAKYPQDKKSYDIPNRISILNNLTPVVKAN